MACVVESVTGSVQATDSTSFTLNMPATRPDNDLYVAIVAHDGSGATTAPGGWTVIDNPSSAAAIRATGYYRLGSSEPASYTWTGAASEQWSGVIVRVSGILLSAPLNAPTPGTGGTAGNDAAPDAGSVTTTVPNALLIAYAGSDNASSNTPYGPSGYTELLQQASSGSAGNCLLQVASKTFGGVGDTGAGAALFTLAASQPWAGDLLAFAPAARPRSRPVFYP